LRGLSNISIPCFVLSPDAEDPAACLDHMTRANE
jgi:hypothetical protein